jgi:endoglucanase
MTARDYFQHSPRQTHGRGRLAAPALATLALIALAALSGPLHAAPPGTLPYGAYDPEGYYSDDPVPVIEHLFLPWQDVFLPSLDAADAYALERNRALLVTIEPWTWTRDERNTPEYLQRSIANGSYDVNMRAICARINTLQSPVTVRWGHEMEVEDGQFIWSDWNPDTYIDAYRRMITVCRKAAPGITVMWSPLGNEGMEEYYPGADYVDLVGISVFGLQAYDQLEVGRDRGYREIMQPRYDRAAGFGKPVVVAELGYSGRADYVAAWEAEVRQPTPETPALAGVVYFNQKEVYPWPRDLGFPDWRIEYRVTE